MKLPVKNKKILKILEWLFSFFYSIFYFFIKQVYVKKNVDNRKCKYYFSVCSIFKNEAPFLREFIEYHRLIGVEHMYLYNNNSSDNYLDVLDEYINDGFVSLIDWEKNYAQCEAYQHCYDNFRKETFWLAFIDIDEFIVPHIEIDIKMFMKRFEYFPALNLFWKMFGTGGLIERDNSKLLIEQFTVSWKNLDGIGKCILNTAECFLFPDISVHRSVGRAIVAGKLIKVPPVTEWKNFLFLPQIYEAPKKNTIQLNHYWSKSFNDYAYKMSKGSAACIANVKIRQKADFFYLHEFRNVSEDRVIFRFLMKLKIRILGIGDILIKYER